MNEKGMIFNIRRPLCTNPPKSSIIFREFCMIETEFLDDERVHICRCGGRYNPITTLLVIAATTSSICVFTSRLNPPLTLKKLLTWGWSSRRTVINFCKRQKVSLTFELFFFMNFDENNVA